MKANFSLDQFKGKKYVILFFYPKDFTFVCPTELIGRPFDEETVFKAASVIETETGFERLK